MFIMLDILKRYGLYIVFLGSTSYVALSIIAMAKTKQSSWVRWWLLSGAVVGTNHLFARSSYSAQGCFTCSCDWCDAREMGHQQEQMETRGIDKEPTRTRWLSIPLCCIETAREALLSSICLLLDSWVAFDVWSLRKMAQAVHHEEQRRRSHTWRNLACRAWRVTIGDCT